MVDVLCFAETTDGTVTQASRQLVAGARGLAGAAGEVVALACGADPSQVAAWLPGADDILLYQAAANVPEAPWHAHAVLRHLVETRQPDLVLIANTCSGTALAGFLAGTTGMPLLASCIDLTLRPDSSITAHAQLYGGKAEAAVECRLPTIVLLAVGALPAAPAAGQGRVSEIAWRPPEDTRVEVEALTNAAPDELDLSRVERLVCVGRGIGSSENIALARDLADALGGEVVASRPVIDRGWIAKSRQVGKSGKTVAPRLYIALGVSGAPEHLEGVQSADCIVAVNTDPTAPIFAAADIGATCDALDLLPRLTASLRAIAP